MRFISIAWHDGAFPQRRIGTVALVALLTLLLSLLAVVPLAAADDGDPRPRVIIGTDGEVDDQASMFRLLLYANDLDIEGIVATSSVFHAAGDPTATPPIPARSWAGTDWIPQRINAGYAAVYSNLLKNDPRYPTPEYLLSKYKVGNI